MLRLDQVGEDPEQRGRRADPEQPGREEDAHLRDERLDERQRGREHDEHEREQCDLEPRLGRVGDEDLRRQDEHDPVPCCRAPLQVGEVATAVLEQRAFVDHRQLEVRVRVVDRLASRLGEHDEREPDRTERETRRRPDGAPRCARDHSCEVGRAGDQGRDAE